MNVTEKDGVFFANNYGHGSSGWTLAPGSVTYVNVLLEKSAGNKLTKNSNITIVGGGVIGLLTAFDLIHRGYSNITIIAEQFDDLASHKAGGLVAFVKIDIDPSMREMVDKIRADGYKFYKKIADGKDPIFKNGAVILPTYFPTREDSLLEPYVGVVMKPGKDVILDFGNGKRQRMVSYDDGIFIDTVTMMEQLKKFLDGKVVFKQMKIHSFNEIKSNFIMNCTGLGARVLSSDDEMIPVQGHLLMLKNQDPSHLQYMICVEFGEGTTKEGFKVTRSFYMFPKHALGAMSHDVGVIGGTFIEGADADHPNVEEFDTVIKNAKSFYGIEDDANFISPEGNN